MAQAHTTHSITVELHRTCTVCSTTSLCIVVHIRYALGQKFHDYDQHNEEIRTGQNCQNYIAHKHTQTNTYAWRARTSNTKCTLFVSVYLNQRQNHEYLICPACLRVLRANFRGVPQSYTVNTRHAHTHTQNHPFRCSKGGSEEKRKIPV